MRIVTKGDEVGWKTVFDGLNEVSKKIYFILFDRFKQRGLFDCFEKGEVTLENLEKRFGVHPARTHRFRVALQGLRALGVLEIEGSTAKVLRKERPDEPVDDELFYKVFSPVMKDYLEIYHRDLYLDPGFSLTFDGQQALLWEGLLKAPINTLSGDQGIEWVGRPGAKVLELAFGPCGTFPKLLEAIGKQGEIHGVDSSHYYVERAKREFRDEPRVKRLVEGDVNDGLSAFEDGLFDGVMFMGTLQFVKDPPALFDEFRRIIKRRGKLVLGAFHTNKPCFSNPALHLHMNMFDPPAFEYPVRDVQTWLQKAGFETNITVEFGSYCSLYAEHLPEIAFDGPERTISES
jgi:ubiquinone/menaquinone biosynthesis C-methylase UbiE